MKRLHTLDISNNCLEVLPAELGALQSLHILKLGRNRLTLLPPEMACLSSLQCEFYHKYSQLVYRYHFYAH